jgi:hypothetical protein
MKRAANRLRSYDGVYFTKPSARKFAHYVEREITRCSRRVRRRSHRAARYSNKRTAEVAERDAWPAERDASEWIALLKGINQATEQSQPKYG